LATRSFARGIYDGVDFVDELLVHDRTSALKDVWTQSRMWRDHRFDLAILFPNAFEAAVVARLAGVPVRIGYATERRSFLLTHPIRLPAWRAERHESLYYLNIISELEQALNGQSFILDKDPPAALTIDHERDEKAMAFLREQGVRAGRPLIALCPGSINSRAKRWPAERYATLADRLAQELGADVLLVGSADELDVSQEVSRHMSKSALLLTGKTDLALAVAILNQVDLLITNDTGPAHIASALGRPTLVIFGPTNPLTTRPLSPVAEILRHPPYCAPCMLRDCPIDHRCMTAISPDEVFERARGMLVKSDKLQFVV
jgi:heptosyltransferase II